MKINPISINQARSLDQKAQGDFGIPSIILMENAGIELAKQVANFLIPPINQCKVVMICGSGNNAGDAFVAARHLLQKGIPSNIFLTTESDKLKEDAAVNFRIIEKLGAQVDSISNFEKRQAEWSRLPVLVVDAILGTGFNQPLRDPALNAIRLINKFKKNHNCNVKVLAVDIPSGLHGDEGVTEPDVVKADITVTFTAPKLGLTKSEAGAFVGRIEVVDIGIPKSLYREAL